MAEIRKLVAALAGGIASSLASGWDPRVTVIAALTAVAVWAVPNAPPKQTG